MKGWPDPGISAVREILGATARCAGGPCDVGGGRLLRAAGGTEEIGATARFKVEVGDVLTILTPGGGAFGAVRGDVGDSGRSGGAAIGATGTQGGDLGADRKSVV